METLFIILFCAIKNLYEEKCPDFDLGVKVRVESTMDHLNWRNLTRWSVGIILAIIPLLIFSSTQLSSLTKSVNAAPLLQGTAPELSFVSTTVSVNENVTSGRATIFVQMDITSPTVVTVDYLTVAGTATPGSDYVSASGTLTFTVSSTAPQTKSFTVDIINDTLFEPNETVNLVLRNPTGGAVLGPTDTAVLTILNDDPAPTATPTATSGAPPIFVDAYEPNNSLATAYSTAADAPHLCNATLWPTGDEDYFSFWARVGSTYQILTSNLDPGLDTVMNVYNSQGALVATNDDYQFGSRASRVIVTATANGFYYARIINQDPTDPANKKYCFGVDEIMPPTPTPTATFGPIAGDQCEFNSTFQTACLIGAGLPLTGLNFVPSLGSSQDTDVFKLWMKPGIEYTCETYNLSAVNDTNIILFDGNTNAFNPPIGNDDKAPGDLGSKVVYYSTYTGWLYVMVGPRIPPLLNEADQYTYDLLCEASAATSTPTPTATFPPAPPGTGSSFRTPTPSPTTIIFPTFPPTPTPIDFSQFSTLVPPTPPSVVIQPLATATPFGGGRQPTSVNLTLYYDSNNNFTPELTEGIVDVAVSLYDNSTGQLIQFGHTNEAGELNFGSISVSGAVRIEVPFLNYSQIVIGTSSRILLRVAPQPLPGNIP